ncbi:MAG: hypothetical protein RL385_121 [Pseudomonadota bacterium]|jgi:hypothetical protein
MRTFLSSTSRAPRRAALAWAALLAFGACSDESDDPSLVPFLPASDAALPVVTDAGPSVPGIVPTGNGAGQTKPADAGLPSLDAAGPSTGGNALDAQVNAPDASRGDAGAVSDDAGAVSDDAGGDSGLDAAAPASDASEPADAGVGTDAGQADSGAMDASTDAGSGDATVPHADLGRGNGRDVITIGDSWMLLLLTGIQESLTEVAMQPYRKYGAPGTQVVTGEIPRQFDTALRADRNIKTVVMTGGGNDILLTGAGADCETGGPNCTAKLDDVAETLDTLWAKMSTSGVQDVVHVMYAEIAVKNNPVKNLPAHLARLQTLCNSHPPMRCFQLNTDSLVDRLRIDGIHPTDENYDKIGKAVFDLMTAEGMRR